MIYCVDMDRDDLSDLVKEVVGELMEQHFGKLRAELAALREDAKPKRRAMAAALRQAVIASDCLYPKDVDTVMGETIDLVITVCDNAKEACPIFPRPIPSVHMPFHDPHGEPLESFVQVLNEIRAKLVPEVARRLGVLQVIKGEFQ